MATPSTMQDLLLIASSFVLLLLLLLHCNFISLVYFKLLLLISLFFFFFFFLTKKDPRTLYYSFVCLCTPAIKINSDVPAAGTAAKFNANTQL